VLQANLRPMPPAKNQITGLILLSTSADNEGEAKLLQVLAPFTLEILEIQRIELRGRFVLGALIAFDPAHAQAIEADLAQMSEETGIDVAIDYSEQADN